MEITADLTGRKIGIAIPCYEGKVQTETMLSMLDTSGKLVRAGISHAHIVIRGGALIQDVRNELTHRFLHMTDCDTMICIDADIQWEWDAFLRLVVLSSLYPIVAGCYPCRTDPIKFIVNNTKRELNEHGLVEANGIGFGFVAVQRKVFENMVVPEYDHENYPIPMKQFFSVGIQDRKPIGEDVWFLREAYKQGYPTMVDPAIDLIHHGQKAYDYRFKDYVYQILGEEDGIQSQ